MPSLSRKLVPIVVVLGLLIVVLVVMYAQRPANTPTTTEAPATQAGVGPTGLTGRKFQFPQLGVEIDLPRGLGGLDYVSASPDSAAQETLYLTTSDYKAAAKACGFDDDSFANIYRIDSIASQDSGTVLVQFDGFFIAKANSLAQQNCELSTEANAALIQAKADANKALVSAFASARLISQ